MFSKLLLFVGFVFLIYGALLLVQHYNPNRLSFNLKAQEHTGVEYKTENAPVHIRIKDLHIDLPLIEGRIFHTIWQTSSQGVMHLNTSPFPGDVGNSILYGHNWSSLLGNLVHAKIGEEMEVTYKDGSVSIFRVTYITEVSPKNIEVLAPSKDKRITIYTCSGFLDSKRYVVVALYEKTVPPTVNKK